MEDKTVTEFDPKRLAMLLGTPDKRHLIPENIIEPKFDGHRVHLHRTETGVEVWARGGTDKTGLLPEIEEVALALPPNTWLDGEAVALKRGGGAADEWGVVQSVLGSKSHNPRSAEVTLMVFDVMMADGLDTTSLPLCKRREVLELVLTLLPEGQSQIGLTPQFPYSPETYEALVSAGYEGGVVKVPSSTYQPGVRGKGWYRLKKTETVDVVVTGMIPGQGKFEGLIGAVVFGAYDSSGQLVNVGQASGMIDRVRKEMTDEFYAGTLQGKVIEVMHFGQMPSGGLRHPQFKRFRDDRDPLSCSTDQFPVKANWKKAFLQSA